MIVPIVALAVIGGVLWFIPQEAYPWIKSIHIFAVVAWMAALLYLPRLFVYHTEAGPKTPQSETFKIMERRLLRGIGTPSMIVTWAAGLWLAAKMFEFQGGWLGAKMLLVVVLTALHMFLAASLRKFSNDENTRSSKFWRITNEVPAVLLAVIIVLVVVKPF
ncbi:protoporphyrinogen oxidase HemJ [Fulvimarina sp. 2208YS6-2-32]|uniref:Protoporphyrinogen IX oxidase n=2 Tax=Fulvimarina uroteuthidis TaxID=3098149 RepID=A0ABU5I0T6_9HYPH|nr:protoporphyrinogen oxidase HemJ [Fulvimarina sp. 2208YS6-2-32]MDY8109006.1 protoporphyrinogen oxidase HemJ [Fulvimarina sp. 2208YS6-2-32]